MGTDRTLTQTRKPRRDAAQGQPHLFVVFRCDAPLEAAGRLTVALSPGQMKLTFSAVRLLLNDLQREQADERAVLWRILEKLPDEHTMRAIKLE